MHPPHHDAGRAAPLPSLMEDIPLAAPAPARAAARRRGPRRDVLREWLGAAAAALGAWLRTRTGRRAAMGAAALLLVGAGIAAGVALWPRPVPDYLNDPMDEVLDFTLLTDDFNKLPIEQRLALIKDLVERLKNSSADDSILMAAFAASIRDKARKQLEENAQRLAFDMLDSYAIGYADVPADDRAGYLDDKVLEFTRMMEDISGEKSGLSEDPNERLAQVKRQAKRDQQALSRDAGPMKAEAVSGFLGFLNKGPGQVTNPAQQARMARFTRDMVRHLRGQDISTGRPR